MNQERNFGVTGAGVGLTVITCLLVALGYWIVLRLVGSGGTPPVEVRPSVQTDPATEGDLGPQTPRPQVLTVDQSKSAATQLSHTANRPQWLPYEEEPEDAPAAGTEAGLTPLHSDTEQPLWPPVTPDSPHDSLWLEPIQVR